MNKDHENESVSDLPKGMFICEVFGHMMVAVKEGRAPVSLIQDHDNAVGELSNKIIGSYKQA